MSIRLSDIQLPIIHEMKTFETKFRGAMSTKVPLLDRIMTYIVKRKGKQLRPMLVFLSAGVCGEIVDKTYRGASLVELLHTATLIHDDVVDDSLERRGFFSINALWKNKIAVLVGDYLLSKGLLLSVDNNDFDLLKISSEAVRLMSEGELLQLEKARKMNFDESIYFDIIKMKTASLIASCCAMGAKSVSDDAEVVSKMRLFGEKVGIAFQIKDDLFDYGDNKSGKPSGNDIKEQKMTLPIIYALNQATANEKSEIISKIKRYKNNPEELKPIIQFIHSKGGVEYAKKMMEKFQSEALEILATFQHNQYNTALNNLVLYTTQRNR